MSTRERLQKKLLKKQQKQLQEIGAANYKRDTDLMRYMVSPETKKQLIDMKNAGMDPQTAYDELVEKYNINQFLNQVSKSKAKREADEIAKKEGELLELKEEKEKIKRKTKKDRDKRKKANKKKRKEEIQKMSIEDYNSAIMNLLSKPKGRGSRSVFDGPNTRQFTRFLPEYEANINEGGRKSKYYTKMARKFRRTRKKRGGGQLFSMVGNRPAFAQNVVVAPTMDYFQNGPGSMDYYTNIAELIAILEGEPGIIDIAQEQKVPARLVAHVVILEAFFPEGDVTRPNFNSTKMEALKAIRNDRASALQITVENPEKYYKIPKEMYEEAMKTGGRKKRRKKKKRTKKKRRKRRKKTRRR